MLWALKLIKDVKSIFSQVDFIDMQSDKVKVLEKQRALLQKYDVIISDSEVLMEPMAAQAGLKDGTIVAYITSKVAFLIIRRSKSRIE